MTSGVPPAVAACTQERFERDFADRPVLAQVVRRWARAKPAAVAIVNYDRHARVTWAEFDAAVTALARQLVRLGFRRGDYLAASLPFLTEHVFLEYACFDIGVIHVPLDPRLKPPDVIRALGQVRAKGFAFPGPTKAFDFRELARALQPHCPTIEHWIQVSPPQDAMAGAVTLGELLAAPVPRQVEAAHARAREAVEPGDGAQAIFTTGSTGPPKPALLSHRNILSQNFSLGNAFGFDEATRLLVNLPPFHIGGQAEELMTALGLGGTVILVEAFDAARSLEAMERERVGLIGQIPAMYQIEWRHSQYGQFDLKSLGLAIYGGQEVTRPFLEQLARMAPQCGTGLGLTEAAGFCTYTRPGAALEEMAGSLGHATPLYPLSIRAAMRADGAAGDPLPEGEVGHVCFRGPQTFFGYVNDAEATARSVSSDGYLYTGDLGSLDAAGLHFAGRAKWVIKPAGHQVFPGDVERHLCALSGLVAACGVTGAAHEVFSEAIIAFVEKRPGVELSVADLRRHARALISFMRPLHYVILEPGQMPLTSGAKTDYLELARRAAAEVERLRAAGKWDR